MTDTLWALIGLAGIAVVAAGNVLRMRRTGDRGCLGHFFVSADHLTTTERVVNRVGIAMFVTGIAVALAL